MKITFIEPKSQFAGWSNFGSFRKMPLLGPVYLATILKNKGHEVEILKETIAPINLDKLDDSDVICFSALSSQAVRARTMINNIKKLFPNKKIIVGGIHASLQPEFFNEADHIIIGEGEEIINDLIDKKINQKIIPGKPVEDLDSLPFPDFSLIKGIKNQLPYYPISTSRGCPFNCKFCSATKLFGNKYRFRSPKSVLEEINSRKEKLIAFYDDNFFSNKARSKEILKKMSDDNTKKWWAEGRTDIARDDELLMQISESNNIEIAVGFESINQKVLDSLSKGQSYEDIINCINKFKENNIKCTGFFLSGTDYDDKNSFNEIDDFIDKHELNGATFSIITPFIGTEVYNEMENNNRIITKDWSAYDTQHVVFKPKNISAYDLQIKQIDMQVKYYIKKDFAWLKFWKDNFSYTFSLAKELLHAKKVNEEYLEFLKKADKR